MANTLNNIRKKICSNFLLICFSSLYFLLISFRQPLFRFFFAIRWEVIYATSSILQAVKKVFSLVPQNGRATCRLMKMMKTEKQKIGENENDRKVKSLQYSSERQSCAFYALFYNDFECFFFVFFFFISILTFVLIFFHFTLFISQSSMDS